MDNPETLVTPNEKTLERQSRMDNPETLIAPDKKR